LRAAPALWKELDTLFREVPGPRDKVMSDLQTSVEKAQAWLAGADAPALLRMETYLAAVAIGARLRRGQDAGGALQALADRFRADLREEFGAAVLARLQQLGRVEQTDAVRRSLAPVAVALRRLLHPAPRGQRRRMADEHNARLRLELGLDDL